MNQVRVLGAVEVRDGLGQAAIGFDTVCRGQWIVDRRRPAFFFENGKDQLLRGGGTVIEGFHHAAAETKARGGGVPGGDAIRGLGGSGEGRHVTGWLALTPALSQGARVNRLRQGGTLEMGSVVGRTAEWRRARGGAAGKRIGPPWPPLAKGGRRAARRLELLGQVANRPPPLPPLTKGGGGARRSERGRRR